MRVGMICFFVKAITSQSFLFSKRLILDKQLHYNYREPSILLFGIGRNQFFWLYSLIIKKCPMSIFTYSPSTKMWAFDFLLPLIIFRDWFEKYSQHRLPWKYNCCLQWKEPFLEGHIGFVLIGIKIWRTKQSTVKAKRWSTLRNPHFPIFVEWITKKSRENYDWN